MLPPTIKATSPVHFPVAVWRRLLATWLVLLATPIHGAFSATRRSIHWTAETLAARETELSLVACAYGVTDAWQVDIPTLPYLVNEGEFGLTFRSKANLLYVVPRVSLTEDGLLGAEVAFGVDLDLERKQFFTVRRLRSKIGSIKRHGQKLDSRVEVTEPVDGYGLEYDLYTDDWNLAYFGLNGDFPYFGFTYAFSTLHIGVMAGVETSYFPVPYFYWRF